MFRDGVSEGEFKIVFDMELAAMKSWDLAVRISGCANFFLPTAILSEAYGSDLKQWPQLTFIIVGKRHHFRFFPLDHQSQDPKGNGNMYAGFVVDQGIHDQAPSAVLLVIPPSFPDITHPVYRDFYLQSQPGLKGST